ncbi:MAG: thioredoxin family protein [Fimbriimonadaceae bacterium]|nr:thioredoxin family protein [Fimbriimonadaceae bacterium]
MQLGDPLPTFALPGTDGGRHDTAAYAAAPVLVVAQICNHCPYVVAYQDRLNALARQFAAAGVQVLALNSNDAARYPSDSFAAMQVRHTEVAMPYPYLHDADQAVAKALGAERTPEFFVFDTARRLVYHGRLDDNLEDPAAVRATWLADAIAAALAGRAPTVASTKPVGCTVKWKE